MGKLFIPLVIELSLAVIGWFIWKPLAGFFVILATGGFVRSIAIIYAEKMLFWHRNFIFILGILYGCLMALIVRYGTLIWGMGMIQKIGLGIWGFIAVSYIAYGAKKYNAIDERRFILDFGSNISYIILVLVLFLVPPLRG